MNQQCKCKRGHCGADGKCANCRTKREQQAWLSRPSKCLEITIVNKHHGKQGEYIGRGSPLGNPYSHMANTQAAFKVATRDEAVKQYDAWLREQIFLGNPAVLHELQRLGDLAISGPVSFQCFCAPQKCHGDVIKQVLFTAIAKTYPDTHWWLK